MIDLIFIRNFILATKESSHLVLQRMQQILLNSSFNFYSVFYNISQNA